MPKYMYFKCYGKNRLAALPSELDPIKNITNRNNTDSQKAVFFSPDLKIIL